MTKEDLQKEGVIELIEAIRDNTETYIVNGVENIVKLQYIATELDELESTGYNSKGFNLLLNVLVDNMEHTLDENLNIIPFVNEKHYLEALNMIKQEINYSE